MEAARVPESAADCFDSVRAVVEHEKSVRRNQPAEHIYPRVNRLFKRVFDLNPNRSAKTLD